MRKKAVLAGKLGFTMIEIMIVVAIIILLAAIAIPGLLRSRMNANEATALTSIKTISWAAITYRTNNAAYPSNISVLGVTNPPYIDTALASGNKQGYVFNLTSDANSFNVTAQPAIQNITGVRSFFSDASGVIRANGIGAADDSSPPVS